MRTVASGPVLVGGDSESELVGRLLSDVGDRGAAIVFRGGAGSGKTALLLDARRAAAARGMRILATSGVESEAHLAFAGLHRLLRPLVHGIPALPAPQRRALQAAFGLTEGAGPELVLIALAALALIGDSAAEQPALLVIDDAHWLDRPTVDVVTFVARRLENEPVAMVLAMRDGFPGVLDGPEVGQHRLERLDDAAAASLLAARAPGLLHRMFPKLGITSRAALGTVIGL